MLGYDSEQELVGLHPAATSPPVQANGEDTATLAQKYIQECLTRGNVRFDWLARRKSGEIIPIEVILTRIQWGGKQIIQAAVNDISQRKRAEAKRDEKPWQTPQMALQSGATFQWRASGRRFE